MKFLSAFHRSSSRCVCIAWADVRLESADRRYSYLNKLLDGRSYIYTHTIKKVLFLCGGNAYLLSRLLAFPASVCVAAKWAIIIVLHQLKRRRHKTLTNTRNPRITTQTATKVQRARVNLTRQTRDTQMEKIARKAPAAIFSGGIFVKPNNNAWKLHSIKINWPPICSQDVTNGGVRGLHLILIFFLDVAKFRTVILFAHLNSFSKSR